METRGRNRLLSALPKPIVARMTTQGEVRAYGLRDVLYQPGDPIRDVLFPMSGVLSIVVAMKNGWAGEIATVGNEGMIGTTVFLGSNISPFRIFCQIPGHVLSIDRKIFEAIMRQAPVDRLLRLYTEAFLLQVAQSV